MTLFRQYFKAQWIPLVIWSAVAALLTGLATQAASGMAGGTLDQFPEQIRRMLGDMQGLSAVDSYVVLQHGKYAALLLAMYAVLMALGVVCREVDRRTVDFLLAQPVERRQVLLARFGVVMVNTGIMAAAMWLCLVGVLKSMDLQGSFGAYALLMVGQWLVSVALAALALLTSLWMDDYSFAVKLWLGAVSGLYFLEYMLKAATVSRWARGFNPFSYVEAGPTIRTGIPAADLVIMLLLLVVSLALAVRVFDRKQITL